MSQVKVVITDHSNGRQREYFCPAATSLGQAVNCVWDAVTDTDVATPEFNRGQCSTTAEWVD